MRPRLENSDFPTYPNPHPNGVAVEWKHGKGWVPIKTRKKSENQKLVDFFRSDEGAELGLQGDYDELTPAETAIRAMRELLEYRRLAGPLSITPRRKATQ